MDSNYDKKLELVKAVREENRTNEARLSHREHILYGYSKPHQYGQPATGQYTETPMNSDISQESISGRSLMLRTFAAIVLAMFFWTIKNEKATTLLGVTNAQVKNYIQEDFSKQVVDYLENITYTLDYEKISTKR